MGDMTAPTLSTTLLSTTLKRGAGGDAIEYGTTDLAAQLIKVKYNKKLKLQLFVCLMKFRT